MVKSIIPVSLVHVFEETRNLPSPQTRPTNVQEP